MPGQRRSVTTVVAPNKTTAVTAVEVADPTTLVKTVAVPGVQGPTGPVGEQGPQGQQGPAGPPGPDVYELEQSFAVAATTWTLNHGFGTYSIDVLTWDQNGDLVEGNVRYPSENTIEIDFYYPTAGIARIFR